MRLVEFRDRSGSKFCVNADQVVAFRAETKDSTYIRFGTTETIVQGSYESIRKKLRPSIYNLILNFFEREEK